MRDVQFFKKTYGKVIREYVGEYLQSISILDAITSDITQRVHVKLESPRIVDLCRQTVQIQVANDTPYFFRIASFQARGGEFAEYFTVEPGRGDHVFEGPATATSLATVHFTPTAITNDLRKYVIVELSLELLLNPLQIHLTAENWSPELNTIVPIAVSK